MEETYNRVKHRYNPMECKWRLDCIFVQNAPPHNIQGNVEAFQVWAALMTKTIPAAIASCATFLFLPHFDVICDILLSRRTATWNLFVK